MDDIEGMTGFATILYLSNIKTGVFREIAFDILGV